MAPTTRFQPSDFVAYCVPGMAESRAAESGAGASSSPVDPGAEAARERFSTLFGRAPAHEIRSGEWWVGVSTAGPASVGHDPARRVTVLLHGETFEPSPRTAEGLATAYAERGPDLFDELNGQFALVVVDHRSSGVQVVTDRFSSRRVFHSRDDRGHRLSTRLGTHPTAGMAIDPVSVAWHLSAGNYFGGCTPFEGLGVLERACAHRLTPDGLTSHRYWSHELFDPEEPVDEAALEAEYEAVLVEAVRRRLDGADALYFSLSAGQDSRGIAAVLSGRLGVDEVRTFSYGREPIRENTDAHLAGEIAGRLGFAHRTFDTYGGDYLTYLRAAVRQGEGMSGCHAAEAWPRIGEMMGGDRRPVILTGEEYLGMPRYPVPTRDVWRTRMRFHPLALPDAAARRLPKGLLARMNAGLEAGIQRIFDRQPPTDDLWRAYVYGAIDQRCTHVVLPWRECFAARCGWVRSPWLDRDVLRVGARIGWERRTDKQLYQRIIERIAPELRDIPRESDEGYRADYVAETRRHAAAIESWLRSSTSRLDELLPPAFGLALLAESGRPKRRTLRDRIGRAIARRTGRPAPPVKQPATKFLRRYALLRMALSEDPGSGEVGGRG